MSEPPENRSHSLLPSTLSTEPAGSLVAIVSTYAAGLSGLDGLPVIRSKWMPLAATVPMPAYCRGLFM